MARAKAHFWTLRLSENASFKGVRAETQKTKKTHSGKQTAVRQSAETNKCRVLKRIFGRGVRVEARFLNARAETQKTKKAHSGKQMP
ncbi:MAG: hypothetical protein IJC63_05590, partial [Myxococcaceae bacterium]|nr:hypothetical protein [Myxococcaceae bacterium]